MFRIVQDFLDSTVAPVCFDSKLRSEVCLFGAAAVTLRNALGGQKAFLRADRQLVSIVVYMIIITQEL